MVSSVKKNPIDKISRRHGARFTRIKSCYPDSIQVYRKRLAPKLGIVPLWEAQKNLISNGFQGQKERNWHRF